MIRRFLVCLVCLSALSAAARGQGPGLKPLQIPSGETLTFYLQTRLAPADGNVIDQLPKGTILKVKLSEAIDSEKDHDGQRFRGMIVTSIQSSSGVVIHAEAEVQGLFVLLRSRNHPDGFRYELLITSVRDGEKNFELTASLNPSFMDSGSGPSSPADSAGAASTSPAPAAQTSSPAQN